MIFLVGVFSNNLFFSCINTFTFNCINTFTFSCIKPANNGENQMYQKTDLEFKEYFEKKIRYTIRKYKLCSKKDRIAVAVSGGKDSTACLYVLNKLGFNVEAITIDVLIGDYTKQNLENLKKFCAENDIKLNTVSFQEEFGRPLRSIRSVVNSKGHDYSSCRICGILKRYLLNKYSKELGFDFLATGHNMDDEAQTFLMNVFKNDLVLAKRQGPVSAGNESRIFVKRIKPLYLLSEKETEMYSKLMNFPVNYGICPCSSNAFRRNFINILNKFEEKHPSVKSNIVNFQEKLAQEIKNQNNNAKITACTLCGEPSSNSVCRTCQILTALKEDEHDKQTKKQAGYCDSA